LRYPGFNFEQLSLVPSVALVSAGNRSINTMKIFFVGRMLFWDEWSSLIIDISFNKEAGPRVEKLLFLIPDIVQSDLQIFKPRVSRVFLILFCFAKILICWKK